MTMAGNRITSNNHDYLDHHEWHRAPVDLSGGDALGAFAGDAVEEAFARRYRTQIEQRESERWVHERRLHVHAEDDAEPDQVDAEMLGCGSEQRE